MYILGISAYFHDSAACLLLDDHIIAAAQEERFSRIKNDARFPSSAIRYCLETAQIKLEDVDHIVFYEKPFLKFERLLETYLAFAPLGFLSFMKAMPLWLKEKIFLKKNILKALKEIDAGMDIKKLKLLFTPHHLSHAASAFYPSPFKKALILTADGVGEWTTTSIAMGEGRTIQMIKEIRFPHSIGLLYSAFTYYLGFKANVDEYKVMGLAPYGKPVFADLIFDALVDLKSDGSFRLNMVYFNYCAGLTMTSKTFDQLFGQPRRDPSSEITAFHMDVACSIQVATEQIMLQLTTSLYKEYQIDNLCMAGGVALNCVVNGQLLKSSGFKNIWVQPAAGDAGGALGAAYAVYHQYAGKDRSIERAGDKMQNSLLGPSYTNSAIKACLITSGFIFEELAGDAYYQMIANYIACGKVVGYFKGRMEFGPRALGARSILADPRNAAMQSILNQKIKYRESFRPFAPAVLEEHASAYFELAVSSPYMLLVAEVKPEHRLSIPAVTHVNSTARIQTVNADSHPDFYQLINAFYKITGYPLLINTSFNRMDEPVVNTPQEAITCFKHTDMDILVMENFIVKKTA